MFSTGDDIVLSVWRERGEEGGITRHTHYQIAVLIRMFFRQATATVNSTPPKRPLARTRQRLPESGPPLSTP